MEGPGRIRRGGLCCESEDKQYRATSEGSRSMKRIKFVGLDVHAGTIAVAVAEQNGEVRSLGVIPNREDSVRKREFTNLYRSAQNGEFTLQDFHENAMRCNIA